jgi:hypothetical protein
MASLLYFRCHAAASAVRQEGHRRVLLVAAHPWTHGSEPPGHPSSASPPAQKSTQQVWMDLQLLFFPTALIIHFILGGSTGLLGFYFFRIWCSLTNLYNFFHLCLR